MKTRSLKDAVGFYLHSRRRLGFSLEWEGALLENFLQHAQELGHRGALTSELALSWAQVPPPTNSLRRARRLGGGGHFALFFAALCSRTPRGPPPTNSLRRARRLEAVRHFALFWAAFDPRTQVAPAGLFGPTYRRVAVHIYTPEEKAALLAATRQLCPPESLYPLTFSTLLSLLACTGLRISEALGLELADWEPTEAVLTIRQTKWGQSRYVPLAGSAATALHAYLRARAKAFPRAK